MMLCVGWVGGWLSRVGLGRVMAVACRGLAVAYVQGEHALHKGLGILNSIM